MEPSLQLFKSYRRLGSCLLTALAITAASLAEAGAGELIFQPVEVPSTDADKSITRAPPARASTAGRLR